MRWKGGGSFSKSVATTAEMLASSQKPPPPDSGRACPKCTLIEVVPWRRRCALCNGLLPAPALPKSKSSSNKKTAKKPKIDRQQPLIESFLSRNRSQQPADDNKKEALEDERRSPPREEKREDDDVPALDKEEADAALPATQELEEEEAALPATQEIDEEAALPATQELEEAALPAKQSLNKEEEADDLVGKTFDVRAGRWQVVTMEEGCCVARYAVVAKVLDAASSTRSRIAKDLALRRAFEWLKIYGCGLECFEAAAYLMSPVKDSQAGGHRLQADFLPSGSLNLPWTSVIEKSVLDASGCSKAAYAAARKSKNGDCGRGAEDVMKHKSGGIGTFFLKKKKKTKEESPLSCVEVRRRLLDLGTMKGSKAEMRKAQALTALFRRASSSEIKWLVRTCIAYMGGCGISLEASVLPAMAEAIVKVDPKVRALARAAFARRPDVNFVCRALFDLARKGDATALTQVPLTPGIPPQPMLASQVASIPIAIDKAITAFRKRSQDLSLELLVEHKYDGQRAQIHRLKDKSLRVFSRKLDDMSTKFKQASESVSSIFQDSNADFIVDAEIVAKATDANAAQASFQSLASRKRKALDDDDDDVPVRVVLFDLIWYDGKDLSGLPLSDRVSTLQKATRVTVDDDVVFATSRTVRINLPALSSSSSEKKKKKKDLIHSEVFAEASIEEELQRSIAVGCEGLMLKSLDASYDLDGPSRRSDSWLKLKRDYLEGMADSLDLVPIGGWRGSGVKRKWISPILLATYDPETGTLGCVTRCMSGFTHAFYKDFTTRVLGHEITDDEIDDKAQPRRLLLRDAPAPGVDTPETCSYWFEPSLVWEIHAAGITPSPSHRSASGIVHASRGLSCRFPRFVRERPDKAHTQATTPNQLADLYRQQAPGQRADLPIPDEEDDNNVAEDEEEKQPSSPSSPRRPDDDDDDDDDKTMRLSDASLRI